jgi:hypothetical protein
VKELQRALLFSYLNSAPANGATAEVQDTRAMQVETTDFLVDLADVNRTKISLSRCSTAEGDVLVKVEQFAFTANNMTYALIGGATGWYWDFFPAPRGWGRIPVWGFGNVVASEADSVEPGEELFGYFPMSKHVVLKPGKSQKRWPAGRQRAPRTLIASLQLLCPHAVKSRI